VKPFVEPLAGSRAWIAKVKADVVGEELVKSTRRTAGVEDVALQERKGRPKAGRSLRPAVDGASGQDISHKAIAERGWEALGSAHGPVVAWKEGNASGAKGPWAKAVRSGASGWDSAPRKPRVQRPGEAWSKPSHHCGVCAPSLEPRRDTGRLNEEMPWLPTGPGKSRRPG
jgi:hypothetical protein